LFGLDRPPYADRWAMILNESARKFWVIMPRSTGCWGSCLRLHERLLGKAVAGEVVRLCSASIGRRKPIVQGKHDGTGPGAVAAWPWGARAAAARSRSRSDDRVSSSRPSRTDRADERAAFSGLVRWRSDNWPTRTDGGKFA
jgi:hypothetical protein